MARVGQREARRPTPPLPPPAELPTARTREQTPRPWRGGQDDRGSPAAWRRGGAAAWSGSPWRSFLSPRSRVSSRRILGYDDISLAREFGRDEAAERRAPVSPVHPRLDVDDDAAVGVPAREALLDQGDQALLQHLGVPLDHGGEEGRLSPQGAVDPGIDVGD